MNLFEKVTVFSPHICITGLCLILQNSYLLIQRVPLVVNFVCSHLMNAAT